MSIRPETTSAEWDNYPVDTTPLPEPSSRSTGLGVSPIKMAGALAVVLAIAGLFALNNRNEDADVSSPPDSLPFISNVPSTTTPEVTTPDVTTPVIAVRWPDDFAWAPSDTPYYSGCTPLTTNSLPDGVWFGYVTSIAETTIGFDLACHYGIDEVDGIEDAIIVNSSPATRELPMAATAEISTFSTSDGPLEAMSAADYALDGWVDGVADAVITVADGAVVEIRHLPQAG